MRALLLIAAIVAPWIGLSTAQAESPITSKMEAFVVEFNDDKEELKEANNVEPDQLVEYQMTYVNKSESSINGLTVVGPVPDGTSYVSATAKADVEASLLVSVDGGKSFQPEPVIRTETKTNGEVVEVVVPPSEYTHLKWLASSAINADGGRQFYSYRVRVK